MSLFSCRMCLPLRLWLVVSGCPDVLLFAFTWLAIIISYHLFPHSSISQLMCLQSSVCLPVLVSDSFLVSHFLCLPIHMSPLVAVSCSCFIATSFVIGPYLCSFLPMCLVVVSGVTPTQTPGSNEMQKMFLVVTHAVLTCDGKKLPTSGASKATNMHADAAMDMERLFGVYGLIYKRTFFIYRTCMPCAPGWSVRACVLCANLLRCCCPRSGPAHDHVAMQREATLYIRKVTLKTQHFTLLASHFTLRTPHFTLHLISSELFSPHLSS